MLEVTSSGSRAIAERCRRGSEWSVWFLEIISTWSCMGRIFSEWYVVTSIPSEFHLCIQATDWIVPEREEVWELLCLLWCFPSRTQSCLATRHSIKAAVSWQVANPRIPQSRSSFGVWHCSPTLGVLAIVIRWYALQSFLFLPVLSLTYLYTSQVWLSIRNDSWWSSRSLFPMSRTSRSFPDTNFPGFSEVLSI